MRTDSWIKKIDHFVITTAHPEECLRFYQALGFQTNQDGAKYTLFSGDFKINVHILGREIAPYAKHVQPGSADFCFEVAEDLEMVKEQLEQDGLSIEMGIVKRHGVRGVMRSIYLRDPDGNLVELSSYT